MSRVVVWVVDVVIDDSNGRAGITIDKVGVVIDGSDDRMGQKSGGGGGGFVLIVGD